MKNFYKKNEEIINYLFIGVCTTVISLVVYYICVYTFLNPEDAIELQIANVISWVAGVIFAYVTNRKIVFKSKASNWQKEFCKFTAARLTTLVADMAIMFVFVTLLGLPDKIMKIISNIIIIILNYIFSKLFVFKNK